MKIFTEKNLSVMCRIAKRTKLNKMLKLDSNRYKDQIAMGFKMWGPYIAYRPLMKNM